MPVQRALSELAKTLGSRGGIGEARIRGATAALGLRKAEYDIGRQRKSDARAEEIYGLQKPALERQAAEDRYAIEEITPNIKQLIKDPSALAHFFYERTAGGSMFEDVNSALEGSTWDPKTGERLNADGTPTKIPREQWEKHIVPGLMNIVIANTDPKIKLTDTVFNIDEAIANMPADAQGDIGALTEQRDQMKAALGDKTKMATAYGRQAATIYQALLQATSTGMNKGYIKVLERGVTRAEKKFAELMGTEKGNLELEKIKLGIENAKSQAANYKKQAKLIDKKILNVGVKPLTKKQQIDVRAKALGIFNAETKEMFLDPNELAAHREKRLPEIEEYLQPETVVEEGEKGPTILTGDAAMERAKELVEKITSGAVNPEMLRRQLYESGQMEVGKNMAALLRAFSEEGEQTGLQRFGIGK